jgi:hypothetical protein
MRIFAGSLRTGFTAILTALLLPVLGFGTAQADFNVGDTITLKVPDLAEFPGPIEEHQFTCRAVTEHAYWLVQDTVTVDGEGPGSLDSLVWGNIITQGELDTLAMDFEDNPVDIYGTVNEYFGNIPDTDGDPRIWIVLATIDDQWTSGGQPIDGNIIAYVNPADLDGMGTFNNQDIIYINIHNFTKSTTYLQIAKEIRRFFLPNGLAMLARYGTKPTADPWITSGLAEAAQYYCYGVTATTLGGYGLEYDLGQFGTHPEFEFFFTTSGTPAFDFAGTRAQAFLWLMYLAQLEGDDIIETMTQSDTTGMVNITRAIDSSVPDSTAVETLVVPIYKDWLVCNITSALQDGVQGGIYRYDIFSDPAGFQFTHMDYSAAFAEEFDAGDYPLGFWLPADGMAAPRWSAQYVGFEEYDATPDFLFNGAYAGANGSGTPIDGKWVALVISIDTTTSTVQSVVEADLDELYNGDIQLEGDIAYLALTNDNEGGPSDLKYVLSQDTDVADVLMGVHQNSINNQYLTVYTTLFDSIPEGFDWVGPIFTTTTSDSTANLSMDPFYGTIWSSRFDAWDAGTYEMQVAGYDSAGLSSSTSVDVAVGYATTGKMTLDIGIASLEVPAGATAPGTMVSLCEAGLLDMAMGAQIPVENVAEALSGIIAGPVTIPDVEGRISFPAASSVGAVYRFTSDGWEKLDSYFQGGRMCAQVSDGGTYAYGEAPGVVSPELPADFAFGGIYPNPFSAEAAIRFSLPSAGRVSVTIYDMTGRAVRTLTDTEMTAADHTLMWDGLDEAGLPVGAGVYFCRLQAAGQTVTQKMLRIE